MIDWRDSIESVAVRPGGLVLALEGGSIVPVPWERLECALGPSEGSLTLWWYLTADEIDRLARTGSMPEHADELTRGAFYPGESWAGPDDEASSLAQAALDDIMTAWRAWAERQVGGGRLDDPLPFDGEVLTDGHGNRWDPVCPECGGARVVIRTGNVRCMECG